MDDFLNQPERIVERRKKEREQGGTMEECVSERGERLEFR